MKEYIKYGHSQATSNADGGLGEAFVLFLIAFITIIPFANYGSGILISLYLGLTMPLLISFSKVGNKNKVDLYDIYPINYKRRVLYNFIHAIKSFLAILVLITLIILFASLFSMKHYSGFIESFKENIPFHLTTHFIITILSFNMFTFAVGFIKNKRTNKIFIIVCSSFYLIVNTVIISFSNNTFMPLGAINYNNISNGLSIFILIITIVEFISLFVFYGVALFSNKPRKEVN